MGIKNNISQKLKRWPSTVGNSSWLVIIFTFIFCLGGFQPSNSFEIDDIYFFIT